MTVFHGTAPVIDRICVLFRNQLNTAIAAVTTSANAVAADADGNFPTFTLENTDIQPFKDLAFQRPHRVAVVDEGRINAIEPVYGGEAFAVGRPRLRRHHRLRIECVSRPRSATAGGWFAAYRHNDRLGTAVVAVLHAFPQLSVPALSLTPLVTNIDIVRDMTKENETPDDDRLMVVRVIGINVLLEEVW